jgi:hypothetical protein
MDLLTIHGWRWNSHSCSSTHSKSKTMSFRMRSLRHGKSVSDLAPPSPVLSGTPAQRGAKRVFARILVGQKSDKFVDGALMQKEIAMQANGLQNLYSAVRSRPAPPTTSHQFSRVSSRSKGTDGTSDRAGDDRRCQVGWDHSVHHFRNRPDGRGTRHHRESIWPAAQANFLFASPSITWVQSL